MSGHDDDAKGDWPRCGDGLCINRAEFLVWAGNHTRQPIDMCRDHAQRVADIMYSKGLVGGVLPLKQRTTREGGGQ